MLLRNCASPYEQAVTTAVRLFEAILSAQVRVLQAVAPVTTVGGRYFLRIILCERTRGGSSGAAVAACSSLSCKAWHACMTDQPGNASPLPTRGACPLPAPLHPAAQKLRAGLKAELGALYPLLLLKPIEAPTADGAHSATMAAEGLLHVCSRPQVGMQGRRRRRRRLRPCGGAGGGACAVWTGCAGSMVCRWLLRARGCLGWQTRLCS